MSIRKFISGVIALAVAATAFAAMAVTASAMDYGPTDVTPGTLVSVKDKGNGTYTQTAAVAGVIADLSELTDIDRATSVTVEFDTYVLGSSTALAQIMYGVGNKKVRGLDGNKSGSSGYKTEGLVTYFGSNDGSTYVIKDVEDSFPAQIAKGNAVHAVVTLDRENDTYTVTLTYGANNRVLGTKTATTAVDNITVIEAFTWGNTSTTAYNITFNNIKVSYTVPDVIATCSESQAFTTEEDYDNNVVVGKYDLEILADSYDLSGVKYKGQPGTITGGPILTTKNVSIAVVIDGAKSTDVLKDIVFE